MRSTYSFILLAILLTASRAPAQQPGYQRAVQAIQERIESNDLDGARTLLTSAIRQYPKDGGLETLLGVVEAQSRHRDAARRDFTLAVTYDPKLLSAWQNLARVNMQDADSNPADADDAWRAYTHAVELDPSDSESIYGASTAAMWSHRYAVSLRYLDKLSPSDRTRARVLAVAVADELGLKQDHAAEQSLSAMAASPDLQESDVLLALPALRAAHRADLLDRLLTAAQARHPLSATGLRTLGLAQEAEGKTQEARATLERVYEMGPATPAPLVDLARIALAQHDNQAALGYLAHARAVSPDDAALAYQYGFVCLQMRLIREAQSAMADAVRLAPGNPDYLLTMGTLATGADALPYLQRYSELRPDDPTGFLARGIALLDNHHPEEAVTWLSKAADHAKTAPSAHYYLGRTLTEQGKYEQALEHLRQADALHPDQPEVIAEMGADYFWLKRYDEAKASLRRALQLDPENYVANYTLLRLYSQTGDPLRQDQAKKFAALRTQREDQYRDAMRVIEARPEPLPQAVP